MSGIPNEKLFYTPDDLVDRLPVGLSVIYRELRQGTIPSIRLGRKFLIPRAAFEKWLENGGLLAGQAANQ